MNDQPDILDTKVVYDATALHSVLQASTEIRKTQEYILQEFDLSYPQFVVLGTLSMAGGQSLNLETVKEQSSLPEENKVDLLLLQLDNMGLIKVEINELSHVFKASITALGSQTNQKINRKLKINLSPVFSQFNSKEIKLIKLILDKLKTVLALNR